jgi:hypothetical protein
MCSSKNSLIGADWGVEFVFGLPGDGINGWGRGMAGY